MSLWSLFSCSVRSFVDTTYGEKTVELPLRNGNGGHISLARLIGEKVPQLKEGSWFWQSPLLGNGHLQTIYGTMAANDHVDRTYYGRRLVTWDDGSTVSVDYVVEPPNSKSEWDESLKYCPIPDPPPYPVRTRYLTPDEIGKFDEDKPLAIVLHGMSGGSHESYVRAMVSTLSSDRYGF
jgi:predicted alpha/beta-fold hydrolase